jgi:hypothetical protein
MSKNKPLDKTKASKLANMLEGLGFPADKPRILSYLNQKSSGQDHDDNILHKLHNNLTDNKQFNNVYEIEKQTGLVSQVK